VKRSRTICQKNYAACLEERVYVVEPDKQVQIRFGPDVNITELRKPIRLPSPRRGAGMATLEPVVIANVILEEIRETFIKVIRRPDDQSGDGGGAVVTSQQGWRRV